MTVCVCICVIQLGIDHRNAVRGEKAEREREGGGRGREREERERKKERENSMKEITNLKFCEKITNIALHKKVGKKGDTKGYLVYHYTKVNDL